MSFLSLEPQRRQQPGGPRREFRSARDPSCIHPPRSGLGCEGRAEKPQHRHLLLHKVPGPMTRSPENRVAATRPGGSFAVSPCRQPHRPMCSPGAHRSPPWGGGDHGSSTRDPSAARDSLLPPSKPVRHCGDFTFPPAYCVRSAAPASRIAANQRSDPAFLPELSQ